MSLEDNQIFVLKHLDPITRTLFLKTTHVTGLKSKLRMIASIEFPPPKQISNLDDIIQITNLMKKGGVPPRHSFDVTEDIIFHICTEIEMEKITEMIKTYFDCGFTYDPCLNWAIERANPNQFEIFHAIYRETVSYLKTIPSAKERVVNLLDHYMNRSVFRFRKDYWIDQILNCNLQVDQFQSYVQLDYENFQLDVHEILNIFNGRLNIDPEIYKPYFCAIFSILKDKKEFEQEFQTLFGDIVYSATYQDGISRGLHRDMLNENMNHAKFFAKSIFKTYSYIKNKCYDFDEKQSIMEWLDGMMKKLIQNHSNQVIDSFLIKYCLPQIKIPKHNLSY